MGKRCTSLSVLLVPTKVMTMGIAVVGSQNNPAGNLQDKELKVKADSSKEYLTCIQCNPLLNNNNEGLFEKHKVIINGIKNGWCDKKREICVGSVKMTKTAACTRKIASP